MALPIFQRTVTNSAGDIIVGAEISVFDESTGLVASIFSNRDGTTALTNPFFTGSDGLAQFYAQQGEYRITASSAAGSVTWRYEPLIGTLDEGAAVLQAGIYAQNAAASAGEAAQSANVAQSASNFQGIWEDQTGAGVVGGAYSHKNATWRLEQALADITTVEPVQGSEFWYLINEEPFEAPCKPTLDLDFANQDFTIYDKLGGFVKRPLADIVTQGRATAGSSVDAIGGITEFGAGENRFTFDGETGEALGYLSEESRTRLNTIYIAPTANESITTTAQSYTISMWGSGTIALSGTYSGTLVGVDEFTRVTLTFTATAGTLTIAYSGACLNVQLEAGAFATSLIQGAEGTAVTRSADSMTRTLGQEWNPNDGTFVVELMPLSNNLDVQKNILYQDLTANLFIYHTPSPNGFRMLDGVNAVASGVVAQAGVGYKIAASSSQTEMSISVNGSQTVVGVTNGGLLTIDSFLIGSTELLGSNFSATFKSVTYYPRAFDALTLQRLSRIQ